MPLQNGLTPTEDVSTAPTMNALNGRPQVQDPIRVPGLTPVAQPTDTFIHPAAPQPTQAEQLANALSGLAPALAAYGSAQQVQQRDDMPGKVAAALTGKTADEQRQVLSTNPDLQNHIAQNLGQQMLGGSVGEATINRLRTEYTTGGFNRDGGNFDKWVNTAINTDLAANKDPHFAETYRPRIEAGVENLRGAQLKYASDQTVQQQDQLIYGNLKGLVGAAVDKGTSPEDLAAQIKNTFATTKTVANKPLAEQQSILVQALSRMAGEFGTDPQYTQKYALLKGVLAAPQVNPDGTSAGSLLDSTTLGGQASDVMNRARKAFDDRQMGANSSAVSDIHNKAMNADPTYKQDLTKLQQDHPDWTTPEHAVTTDQVFAHAVKVKQAADAKAALDANYQIQKDAIVTQQGLPLLQAGNGHALQDRTIQGKDGKPEVYSAKDQLSDSVSQAQTLIDQRYAGQTSPQATTSKFQDEAKLYTDNGIVNPAWKDLLHAAPAAASTITAAGGDPTPTLATGYDTYMRLRASSPGLLAKHVDQKGQDSFENARVMQQDMGMDQKQAFSIAAKAANDPNWNRSDPGISKRDKDQAITSALTAWKWPWQTGMTSTINASQPAVEVSEAAEALHRGTGLPWPQAIQQAGARVQQNYTIINGSAVRTADKQVPTNFGDLAGGYIDGWAETHAAQLKTLGYDKSDITLQSLGATNNWALQFKGHPAPIQLPGAAFSIPDLYNVQKTRALKAGMEADKGNAAAEATAQSRQRDRLWNAQNVPDSSSTTFMSP